MVDGPSKGEEKQPEKWGRADGLCLDSHMTGRSHRGTGTRLQSYNSHEPSLSITVREVFPLRLSVSALKLCEIIAVQTIRATSEAYGSFSIHGYHMRCLIHSTCEDYKGARQQIFFALFLRALQSIEGRQDDVWSAY